MKTIDTKTLLLSALLSVAISLTRAQLTPLQPDLGRTRLLSSISRNRTPIVDLYKINSKNDSIYSLHIFNKNEDLGIIYFRDEDSVLSSMCRLYLYYLQAPYHTNDTYQLGSTRITLVTEINKKKEKGVQMISEKGILTLWGEEARRLFCLP